MKKPGILSENKRHWNGTVFDCSWIASSLVHQPQMLFRVEWDKNPLLYKEKPFTNAVKTNQGA